MYICVVCVYVVGYEAYCPKNLNIYIYIYTYTQLVIYIYISVYIYLTNHIHTHTYTYSGHYQSTWCIYICIFMSNEHFPCCE